MFPPPSVRRGLLVAGACLIVPATAQAAQDPPVTCSATPATAFVNDAVAFHAEAPATAVAPIRWYIAYSGSDTLSDSGITGATFDLSRSFTAPTSPFGENAQIGYVDANGSTMNVPICTARYTVSARPDNPPTAAISGPATVVVGQSAAFSAAGSADPEGQPLRYAFDFDGSAGYEVDNGTSPVVNHVFTQADTGRRVSVEVTDPAGQTASASMIVAITSGSTAGPGPGPGGPTGNPPQAPDRTKPSAKLKISTTLTSVESLGTDFVFGIDPSEDLSYTGKVTLTYKRKTYVVAKSARTKNLGNSGGGFVEKTMRRGSIATFRRLNTIIPKGTKVPITLTLTLKDTAGNTATVTKTVKIKKRYRGSGRTG